MKTSRNDGLSLVETMVVLSILATGLTLTAPSWNDARSKRELESASGQFAQFLSSGRSLAVKHNRDIGVSLVYEDPTHWCVGFSEAATACDCTVDTVEGDGYCAVGGVRQVLQAGDLAQVAMTEHSQDTFLVFDRVRGTLTSADFGNSHYFNLLSANEKAGLQVGVSATGNTFICTWKESDQFPAYRSCEPVTGDLDSLSREGALYAR